METNGTHLTCPPAHLLATSSLRKNIITRYRYNLGTLVALCLGSITRSTAHHRTAQHPHPHPRPRPGPLPRPRPRPDSVHKKQKNIYFCAALAPWSARRGVYTYIHTYVIYMAYKYRYKYRGSCNSCDTGGGEDGEEERRGGLFPPFV